MSVALKWDFIPVEDYLASELNSETKHEYRDGITYAMAGSSREHSQVSSNALISLGAQLRGKQCRPFNSDLKIRIQLMDEIRFYYPDVSVVCDSGEGTDQFVDEPRVIIEVLSPSTRRTDLSEKKDAYLTISSLAIYMVVEPDQPSVLLWRRKRDGGFDQETYSDAEDQIPMPEIDAQLRVSDLYEGISFS